jgi:DNA-binding transcriptional MerR regulator
MTAKARSRPVKAPRRRPLPAADRGEIKERPLKIGEAARALDIEAYVLRFWETQFPFLRPRHARSKHRFYGEQDLETLRLIKRLLHQERFTIEGAKKYIREVGLERALGAKPDAAAAPLDASGAAQTAGASSGADAHGVGGEGTRRALAEVRRELESLHKLLKN